MIYGGHFDVDKKKEEINNLEEKTKEKDFWNNEKLSQKIFKDISSLKNIINPLEKTKNDIETNLELLELGDNELIDNIKEDIDVLEKEMENLEKLLLLNGKYDSKDCILEIHSGAGGTEACDWAVMLYRMYTRWCEKNGYKIKLLDYQEGDETGIRSCSIEVSGENAYGYLNCEKGVHRLVRLSPFDSNNKRHTSFASVEVTPVIDNDINIEIQESDLKIDVYRSSGCGGQGVNTTDSAVRITHLPTKTVVTCQNERSQIQNKEEALRVLKIKLQILEEEKREKEMNNIKGTTKNIEFGSQIRSYVMHPYSLVKDHRTSIETSNVSKVLDGYIDIFIDGYLKEQIKYDREK